MRKEGRLERNREDQGERKSTGFKDIHTYAFFNRYILFKTNMTYTIIMVKDMESTS